MTVPIDATEDVTSLDWHSVQEIWPVPATVLDDGAAVDAATLTVAVDADDSGTGSDAANAVNAVNAVDTAIGIDGALIGQSSSDTATGVDVSPPDATSDDQIAASDDARINRLFVTPTGDPIGRSGILARNGLDGGYTILNQGAEYTIAQAWQSHSIAAINSNYFGTSTPFDACEAIGYGRGQYDMRTSTATASTYKFVKPTSADFGAGRFALLAPGDEYFCQWNESTIGAHNEMFARLYLKLWDAPDSGEVVLAEWLDTTSSYCSRLVVDTSGVLTLRAYDDTDTVIGSTGTGYALTEDTWYRFESRIRFSPTPGDGITGALSAFYLFAGNSRTVLAGEETWHANALNERCDRFRIGVFGTPTTPTIDDRILIQIDDVVIGAVDWIGVEAEAQRVSQGLLARESEHVTIVGTVDISDDDTATGTDSGIGVQLIYDGDDAATDDADEYDTGGVNPYVFDAATADDSAVYEDA